MKTHTQTRHDSLQTSQPALFHPQHHRALYHHTVAEDNAHLELPQGSQSWIRERKSMKKVIP